MRFVFLLLLIGLLPTVAAAQSRVGELLFIYGVRGDIPLVSESESAPKLLQRLTRLKRWQKQGSNRVVLDAGNNHMPATLGKFSSGLVMEDILLSLGSKASFLGYNELQLDMDTVAHLKRKKGNPLIGGNIPYSEADPGPFEPKGFVKVGANPGIAVVFLYDVGMFRAIDPRDWPIVGRMKFGRNQSENYLKRQMGKLKGFEGPIVLLTNLSGNNLLRLMKNHPRIHTAVRVQRFRSFDRSLGKNKREVFSFAQRLSDGRVMAQAVPFSAGAVRVAFFSQGQGYDVRISLEPFRRNLPQQIDPQILASSLTWSKLYLQQDNPEYVHLSRALKKGESLPFIARMLQDYHDVEWVGLPRSAVRQISLGKQLNKFELNRMLQREEQLYKFRVRGKTLSQIRSTLARYDFFWQPPGKSKIDERIYYSVLLPASFYHLLFYEDLVPEEHLDIKTWKDAHESVVARVEQKKQAGEETLPVDYMLKRNPMWRFYWKLKNGFSWKMIQVEKNESFSSQPNYVTNSSDTISLDAEVEFVFENIYNKISLVPRFIYAKTDDKLINNQMSFTVNYENSYFFLKPYWRNSVETLIDHEAEQGIYPERPWILTSAAGISVPIWLTNHKVGLRMEKDVGYSQKTKYGIEYILDFSKVFFKFFEYIFKAENYLSYNQMADYNKIGADLNLENSLKVNLIGGLNLVLSYDYLVYQTSQGTEGSMGKLANNKYQALLVFEKAW